MRRRHWRRQLHDDIRADVERHVRDTVRHHRHWHQMRHGMRHYYSVHLHRRLFWWFGASIFFTGLVYSLMSRLGGPAHPPRLLLLFGVPALVLWAISGKVSRRLAQPIYDIVQVTKEIGDGNLSARAGLDCSGIDELGLLAQSINDMATRIERQLADQKQLLAEVSHELRTPLARIRLLVEIARGGKLEHSHLDEIERETVEIDALVGELLASARLDFSALNKRPLDAADLARRAAERAGLPPETVIVEATETRLTGDATLLGRALANLLDNARKHGGGAPVLRVRQRGRAMIFEVSDSGAGFPPGEVERFTEALARGERPRREARPEGSLGLGLALVYRIARAHEGHLALANRPEGGARVTLEVPS
jgi:signal transduction histidine kinase